MPIHFEEKFIAFVDVLGFKSLVGETEAGSGLPLEELLNALDDLGMRDLPERFRAHGFTTCPMAPSIRRDLSFQVTQVSDSVVASTEVSPAGVVNLLCQCWTATLQLLHTGFMCRGYVTRGSIYHTERHVVGTGFLKAYEGERGVQAFRRSAEERGTPFVEVDNEVMQYIANCGDSCVKEMVSRFVRTEGGTSALFPFKRLSHQFGVGGFFPPFDPERERRANQQVRDLVYDIKRRVSSLVDEANLSAVEKSEHYLQALDEQIVICDRTDEIIQKLRGRAGRSET